MGWKYYQIRRIENGICVHCGSEMADRPNVTCRPCLDGKRADSLKRYRDQMIDGLASIGDKKRARELYEYCGQSAKPEWIGKLLNLEKRSPGRFKFFQYLFDERRWTVGKFDDRNGSADDLNDLLIDCIQYAQTIPDPAAEMADLQRPAQIETRNRSSLAIAIESFDGMTGDDFSAVSHLY